MLDPAPMLRALLDDVRAGVPVPRMAARFHNGLSDLIRDVCLLAHEATDYLDALWRESRAHGSDLMLGLLLWFAIWSSGIHATIAGVLTASLIPIRRSPGAPAAF